MGTKRRQPHLWFDGTEIDTYFGDNLTKSLISHKFIVLSGVVASPSALNKTRCFYPVFMFSKRIYDRP